MRSALWLLIAVALVGGADRSGADLDPDRPDSWQLTNPDLYAVDSRDDRVWVAGYWGSLLRSEDAGGTWARAVTPTHATLYDVSFADAVHGWAVGEGGCVLRSTDGGATWLAQAVTLTDDPENPRPLDSHLFSVHAVSAHEAWAVGDLGIVIHTRDGGTWEQVVIPEEAFADQEVPDRILNGVDFTDPLHGWIVGEFGTALRSVDGGHTWVGERRFTGASSDLYLFDVSARNERDALSVGLAGTVLATEDGGAVWDGRRTPGEAGLYAVTWADGAAVVVGDRGEVYASAERARGWMRAQHPPLFNWLSDVSHAGRGRLYAVGEKGLVLRSDDRGVSWTQLLGRQPLPLAGVSVPDYGPVRERPRKIPLPSMRGEP